jgi:hypothetical protein
MFSYFRLARRALRLDKMNVIPVEDGLCIIYQGKIWYYNEKSIDLTDVAHLRNCRNVLHQSIVVLDKGKTLYIGEYGANSERNEVPVWRSTDGGKNWHEIFKFPPKKIKHIHGCYYDQYEDKIWTLTGDFAGECFLLCGDRDFQDIEWIGNGQQCFRACNVFFEQDAVHWIMDSQLEDSYHIVMNRATRRIEQKTVFPGPVWYIKRLCDNYYLAATAVEIGPGVHDNLVHIMASRDLDLWEDIYQFHHDGLPKRYFKFGVLGFADGNQSSQKFYIFGEALKGLDGKAAVCRIV